MFDPAAAAFVRRLEPASPSGARFGDDPLALHAGPDGTLALARHTEGGVEVLVPAAVPARAVPTGRRALAGELPEEVASAAPLPGVWVRRGGRVARVDTAGATVAASLPGGPAGINTSSLVAAPGGDGYAAQGHRVFYRPPEGDDFRPHWRAPAPVLGLEAYGNGALAYTADGFFACDAATCRPLRGW